MIPYSSSSLAESPTPPTTPYASLAKYKVDRAKQQYQLQQQLHRLQQRIYQQQQHLSQQLSKSYLDTAQSQYTPIVKSNQYQQHVPRYNNQYQPVSPNYVRDDLNQPFFSDQQTLQLHNYFEQQRQLEILQRQREQLLLQQQELRRQQELLKLEQLQRIAATSTTTTTLPPVTNPPITSTTSPLLLSSPTARRITPAESELFLKAIATHQKKFTSPTASPTTQKPTTIGRTRQERVRLIDSEAKNQDALLSLLQGQSDKGKSQVKVVYQTDQQQSTATSSISDRDALLRQLKQVLSKSNDLDDERNVTTRYES